MTTAVRAARSAGLTYVCDERRGITRQRTRGGFRYIGPRGRMIRDLSILKRIRALAVPPAWTGVWICPDARGHVQATGRDARGRKQYRYHAGWRACRDETKFDRLEAFAMALPKIRTRTAADLSLAGLPREKVLATVVQLLDKSLIRVGNDEYARTNNSFGLTTLRDRHVEMTRTTVRFEFRGKSGKQHAIDINDARLARIVKQCRDLPGQELFHYVDDDGRRRDVNSADVNAYLKEITGEDFTAKEFRTWSGTVLAATALGELDAAPNATQANRNVARAIEAVAIVLGNTRAVCRKSYIHPAVLDSYMSGASIVRGGGASRRLRRRAGPTRRADEAAVLRFLHACGRGRPAARAA